MDFMISMVFRIVSHSCLVLYFCICCGKYFEHLDGTKGWHVAFACMAGVGLLAYARVKGTQPLEDKVYGVAGMLFILYGMILLLYTLSRREKCGIRLHFVQWQ